MVQQPKSLSVAFDVIGFQYILCYGSTIIDVFINNQSNYFNTSYVMVQLLWVDLFLIYQEISIHLMLWFNSKSDSKIYRS